MAIKHAILDAVKYHKEALSNESQPTFLVHQINLSGGFGSGIAGQIRQVFPTSFSEYQNQWEIMELGDVLIDENNILHIAGQREFGKGIRHTHYGALAKGFMLIADEFSTEDTIVIPHGIGCGLGGGDWSVVEELITTFLGEHSVLICSLPTT